ncbi:hypothetical protein [Emcibacter nanhaiensis]|uniref:Leucyl aminopeptidase n=1 Tax=Emcibacter nanhaiensis TaxID=1505037 RepID=A0A501PJG5_9PROT|nr:hypothetical protein [Emcibacter nanhaiensis]TPD60188.1 hypothetical protein FIV46_09025 [Emcibacter nanhaiensis]
MIDYSDVSFELKPEFLKVTRFILEEQAVLKEGEKVLLIYDSHTPQHVINAFLGTAMQLGADAYSLKVPMAPHPAVQPAFTWDKLVENSARNADLIIDMAIGYAEFMVHLVNDGARIIMPGDATGAPHIEDSLIRCLLLEDPYAVRDEAQKITDIMSAGKSVHITSEIGTDFTLDVEGVSAEAGHGFMSDPETGEVVTPYQITPGAMPGYLLPAGSGDGILAIDGVTLYENVHQIPQDPVFLTLEKGKIVDVRGDRRVATRLREWLQLLDDEGCCNGPVHANIGLSRMARLTEHLEWERVRGSMVFGFGDNSILGPYYSSSKMKLSKSGVHWDAQILTPTLDVDDIRISENGIVQKI